MVLNPPTVLLYNPGEATIPLPLLHPPHFLGQDRSRCLCHRQSQGGSQIVVVVVGAAVVKIVIIIISRDWAGAKTKSLFTHFYLDVIYKTAFLCQHIGNAITLSWRLEQAQAQTSAYLFYISSFLCVCITTWHVRIYSPVFTGIYIYIYIYTQQCVICTANAKCLQFVILGGAQVAQPFFGRLQAGSTLSQHQRGSPGL